MNNDTMKKSELQDIIREALLEVIEEGTAEDKKAQDMALAAEKAQLAALNKKKAELTSQQVAPADKPGKDAEVNAINKNMQAAQMRVNKLSKPGMASTELDEMANVGVRYQLSDDATDEQIAGFSGKKAKILAAIQAAGSAVSKMNIAGDMGYDKQNPINKDFMELVDAGIIVSSTDQAAPRLTNPRPAATATATTATGDEELFYNPRGRRDLGNMFTPRELTSLGISGQEEMSDEEVEAAFAAAKASGEEPEPEIAPTKTSKSSSTISDEDFQDWMEYSKLSDRLKSVKSNLLKTKRYRSTPGDINDVGSTAREIKGLTDLKASLEQRIDALVAKSEYLQKDIAKKAGKEYIPAPPIPNPLEDEDEEDDLNENTLKHRMQYYAGIKK
jgi:hypothetical protein